MIIVAGGTTDSMEELVHVEVFDIKLQTWSNLQQMLSPCSPVYLSILGDDVYAMGPVLDFIGDGPAGKEPCELDGEDGKPCNKDEVLDVYDLKLNAWREAPFPVRTRTAYTGVAAVML